jgi:hypothetical protein
MGKEIFTGLALVAALGLALGGCDDKPNKQQTKNGQATLRVGNTEVRVADDHAPDVALPSNLPPYAAVYPGGRVRAVVTTSEADIDAMITYTTTAKPQDVLAFYKRNTASAGLETSQDLEVGGIWNFAAQKKDGEANLSVIIMAENGRYTVQETYR